MGSRKEIIGNIPLTVPRHKRKVFLKNFLVATRGTGKLFMFACDQKVEHLNDDFVGRGIPPEAADPEHLFKIAQQAEIGVMATQLGLVARYGEHYRDIPYIIKLNSKTHLIKIHDKDPNSTLWYSLKEVVHFQAQSRLSIVGVGYTIYIGSWYEPEMFRQAAHVIYHAHQHGLLAVVWMYPRGKAVRDEKDAHLIAGGAGVACALGADFAKIQYPRPQKGKNSGELLQEAVAAAGRCGVICVGGPKVPARTFLQTVYDQIHIGGARGVAIGRNIYQRPQEEAVRMANAISAILYRRASVTEAYKIFKNKNGNTSSR